MGRFRKRLGEWFVVAPDMPGRDCDAYPAEVEVELRGGPRKIVRVSQPIADRPTRGPRGGRRPAHECLFDPFVQEGKRWTWHQVLPDA